MNRRRSKTADRGAPWAETGPREFLAPLARILNAWGCHPRDLQREFVRICRELPTPKPSWEPMRPGYLADLSHVIARWHADEQYVDAEGRPLPLPLEGPEPSLKGLISRVLPGIDPDQPLQWLMRLEGIRRRGKRFLPTDNYLAFNRSPAASLAHGLTGVLGMLSTVERNIPARPDSRLLERMAINPRFPVRALPHFHRKLKREAGEILRRFDADMGREEIRLKGEPVTRLCIGLYVFEDPPVRGNDRLAIRQKTARRLRKRRSPTRRK